MEVVQNFYHRGHKEATEVTKPHCPVLTDLNLCGLVDSSENSVG